MNTPALFTALITPFIDDQVDYQGFEHNLKCQIQSGVEGLLVLGTTAESPTLSVDEKEKLIKKSSQLLGKKAHLMVGIGTNCTKSSIENAHIAEHYGASSALVISPYYNKPSQTGLLNHFKEIANNTSIPIVLYNHPGRSGQNISIETLQELVKIPQIIGIKDASSDLGYLQKMLYFIPKSRSDFKVFCGDDLNAIPYFSLGAQGLISVASNLIPSTMKSWISSLLLHDATRSMEQFKKLYALFSALNLEINPTGIKAALDLCEKPAGAPRLPLVAYSAENREILKQTLIQTEYIHGEIKSPSYQTTI